MIEDCFMLNIKEISFCFLLIIFAAAAGVTKELYCPSHTELALCQFLTELEESAK